MYLTILKTISPYLQRLVATKVADYLQSRREQQQEPSPSEADQPLAEPSLATSASTANTIWFSLSGLLLGSAFSVIIYLLIRDASPQQT